MRPVGRLTGAVIVCVAAFLLSACVIQPGKTKPRMTLFVGVDASGSFKNSGDYEDAISFLSQYLYGHLNELGGLGRPKHLFVGSIGGKTLEEAKAFHPIQDFQGKSQEEIQAALLEWFPPEDTLTDFNTFFREIARISKERNLTLAPITVMIVSDGIPDASSRGSGKDSEAPYQEIDFSPMEYLSRNLTVRLTYASPQVSDHWRKLVPRRRVRLWTANDEVMRGWSRQLQYGAPPERQIRLWDWVKDNVDFRVRARII
jgi:hypothetical protein